MAVLQDNRIRDLFRKYGKTAVGVHLTVYAATLTGLYVAVENKFDPVDFLVRHGLLSEKALHVDKKPEERGWFANLLTGPGSSLAIAFLCTKALLPVRVPITMALTPPVARLLHQRAADAAVKTVTTQGATHASATSTAQKASSPVQGSKP
jgi:hypothetical protein